MAPRDQEYGPITDDELGHCPKTCIRLEDLHIGRVRWSFRRATSTTRRHYVSLPWSEWGVGWRCKVSVAARYVKVSVAKSRSHSFMPRIGVF